jgi:beta-glucosidase
MNILFSSPIHPRALRIAFFSLLVFAASRLGAAAQHAGITHAQAVARAKSIVARMTLDEKIAQLHGIRDPENYRVVPGLARLGIPAFHMTNGPAGVGPGGAGPQKPATAMPAPIALAATWDPELARAYGKLEAEETRSLGSQLFESPDINIARVPQGGRVFESFGEDPFLTSRIAVADIEGIQSANMMANVKHYLANNQESARMSIDEIIGERALREIYLPGFEASIKEAHSASVMCAYPKVNGLFNCESAPTLTDVLKKEWRFDGFAISDWGATHSTVASATNGLDLEMPTGKYFADELKKAVESGQVPVARIDEMLVRRFAKMIEFGLFGPQPKPAAIPAFEHGATSRDIAEQGMVLLKNEGNLLPLDRATTRTIALIGPWAVRPSTGGGGSSHVIPLYSITPYDGLNAAVDSQVTRIAVLDGSDIDAAIAAAKRAQIAIVMVGDQDSEGRDQSLELPAAQTQLVEAVARANPKTVVVLKSGSAILMPWIDDVAAILEAWYPGEEDGRAVAAVLLGDTDPSGKLPITFPRSTEDTLASNPAQYPGVDGTVRYSEALEVGYRAYAAHRIPPLFPFGFGLSYTTFSFDGLSVTHEAGDAAMVSFRVSNTGQRAGAEVAQLYLGFPPIAEGNEPPIQLKGFQRVMLKPGESQTVKLNLGERSFSYWSEKAHGWQIANGDFEVMVGDSSANTPLRATVTMRTH